MAFGESILSGGPLNSNLLRKGDMVFHIDYPPGRAELSVGMPTYFPILNLTYFSMSRAGMLLRSVEEVDPGMSWPSCQALRVRSE